MENEELMVTYETAYGWFNRGSWDEAMEAIYEYAARVTESEETSDGDLDYTAEQELISEQIEKLKGEVASEIERVSSYMGLGVDYTDCDGIHLAPEQDIESTLRDVITVINGEGIFEFKDVQEFLDSGPYTPYSAVRAHLHYMGLVHKVYGI